MNLPVLSSTFFLTLLLLVGLFFFIRASIKDRTEQAQFQSTGSEDWLLQQLQGYFERRAYQVASLDKAQNQVTFAGFVRPSWFLAILLSTLAAVGLLCLALVLSYLFPNLGNWSFLLALLAPGAGLFYWKGAGRVEEVKLRWTSPNGQEKETPISIAIAGHRDELRQIKLDLPFLKKQEVH